MQQITISGTLLSDAEKCVDKSGKNYSRFTVSCGSTGPDGRVEFTHYRCICYISGYEKFKKGDQAFVTGKLSARLRVDDKGRTYMNLDIMVYQLTGGYRARDGK